MRTALLLLACLPLVAQQGTGTLKTKVSPSRAGVFIDGKYVGPAGNFASARKYTVAAGEHEVKLVEPRYQDVVKKVTIVAGKTTDLTETMTKLPLPQPPFGGIRIVGAEKFAAVYLWDKYMGHADEFNAPAQRLLVPPGQYGLKIVSASGATLHDEKITVEANKTVTIHVK